MCSLDFWRRKNDVSREKWVLLGRLDICRQIGVDVSARMREYTHDRQ